MMNNVWIANLLRKDDHDLLDTIYVEAGDKWEAMDKATLEYRGKYTNFFHYAYIWVDKHEGRKRSA